MILILTRIGTAATAFAVIVIVFTVAVAGTPNETLLILSHRVIRKSIHEINNFLLATEDHIFQDTHEDFHRIAVQVILFLEDLEDFFDELAEFHCWL